MLNEVREPSHVETDKNVRLNGTLTVVGASSFTGAITGSGSIVVPGVSMSGTTVVALGTGTNSGSVLGGSVTVNGQRGLVTTASLTTGSYQVHSFDLKNTSITPTSQIFLSVYAGTNTLGLPVPQGATVATAGSATVNIGNAGSVALDGTLKVNFLVMS